MIANAIFGTAFALFTFGLCLLFKGHNEAADLSWVGSNALYSIANMINGDIGLAIFNGSLAAIIAILWWRRGGGKRTKKAARHLGEKSKARVQALVEQMTPSPVPSPVGAS